MGRDRTGISGRRRRGWAVPVALAACAAVAALMIWWLIPDSHSGRVGSPEPSAPEAGEAPPAPAAPESPDASGTAAAPAVEPRPAEPPIEGTEPEMENPPVATRPGDHRIASGETLELDSGSLPTDTVLLDLTLGERSKNGNPREARVLSEDGRVLEILAPVDADRTIAQLELPSEWLEPGRYILEVKTTELTHLPLRRFALEIR